MKAYRAILPCAIFLAAAFAMNTPAEATADANSRPRVAVAGFANRTGDASFDEPAETAGASLALTLRMLGAYSVEPAVDLPPKLEDRALLAWCDENAVDYLLFGEIAARKDGTQAYALSVFDRAAGRTTSTSEATGSSIFDVFSASDELTLATVDRMTGAHVAFGSVSFVATGDLEGVLALIDGIPMPGGLSTIDRIAAGTHEIRVVKRGPSGDVDVMKERVSIVENAVTTITVTVKQTTTGPGPAPDLSDASRRLVYVEGGTFTMGTNDGPRAQRPAHEVTVGDFWMSATEITQEDFEPLMRFKGMNGGADPKRPVTLYNWIMAIQYCNARSVAEGLAPAYKISGEKVTWDRAASGYRLPTEAEWEYAAKGGRHRDPYFFPGSDRASETCWTVESADKTPIHSVALKKSNSLGLYDMGGNLYEWCWDVYAKYPQGAVTDPEGPSVKGRRVIRGGDALHGASAARCLARDSSPPEQRGSPGVETGNGQSGVDKNIGFRVVRSVTAEERIGE